MGKIKVKNKKNNPKSKKQMLDQQKAKEGIEKKKEDQLKFENKISNDVQKIINELTNELNKKNVFQKKEKELIQHQIKELNNLLENKEFHVLKEKIDSLEKLYLEEKKENENDENNKTKEKFSFKQKMYEWISDGRIPFYSRFKKIMNTEDRVITKGNFNIKLRTLKIIMFVSIYLLLFGIACIGILMLLNVIPFGNGNSDNLNYILPALLLAIPIGLIITI